MGADIHILGCRWGPWDTPSSTGHRLCPLAETGGLGWPRRREGLGGRGAAGAGTGACTCQTRAKEQTSFLVTLFFSPFWQQPLGARGS